MFYSNCESKAGGLHTFKSLDVLRDYIFSPSYVQILQLRGNETCSLCLNTGEVSESAGKQHKHKHKHAHEE